MNLDFGSMLGAVAAPFTGGASLALMGLSSAASVLGDKYAMKKQQAFEREMSSTAHQREVADLRSAGLNPILSATGGGGASYHGVPAPDFGSGVVSSAIGARRTAEEIRQMKATTENINVDTFKKGAEYDQIREVERRTVEETRRTALENANLLTQGEILKKELSVRSSAEAAARTEEQIDRSTAGKILRWLDRFSKSVRGVGSSARSFER